MLVKHIFRVDLLAGNGGNDRIITLFMEHRYYLPAASLNLDILEKVPIKEV